MTEDEECLKIVRTSVKYELIKMQTFKNCLEKLSKTDWTKSINNAYIPEQTITIHPRNKP